MDEKGLGEGTVRVGDLSVERLEQLDVTGMPVDEQRVGDDRLERRNQDERNPLAQRNHQCHDRDAPGDLHRRAERIVAIAGPAVGFGEIAFEIFDGWLVHDRRSRLAASEDARVPVRRRS